MISLETSYAVHLPELATPWQADSAPSPQLVHLNDALALRLGLQSDWLRSEDGVQFLLGQKVPEGAKPVAQAYAGHQFGVFRPQLGDGRALLLGELTTPDGTLVDLHLKGSGPTPYARAGDGRAVLAPMLRELLISEAMYALGVPTTEALAVLTTGRHVSRDRRDQQGAVLVRVATSHLRVGTFQLARSMGDADLLRRLADFAIERHHQQAAEAHNRYLALLDAVITAQAELVSGWMGLGFVHGVLNTDNVTVSGETIDYGPCAFRDRTDPDALYSSIDTGARYSYKNQPGITGWNLARFAESLIPLLAPDPNHAIERAQAALSGYEAAYHKAWAKVLRRKLAIDAPDREVIELANDLQDLVGTGADHTMMWRSLPTLPPGTDLARGAAWLARWQSYRPNLAMLAEANPMVIPRNHLVQEALDAADAGEFGPFERLRRALAEPYAATADQRYREAAPDSFGEYTTYCGT